MGDDAALAREMELISMEEELAVLTTAASDSLSTMASALRAGLGLEAEALKLEYCQQVVAKDEVTAKELANATSETKCIIDKLRSTRKGIFEAGLGADLQALAAELETTTKSKQAIEAADTAFNTALLEKETGTKLETYADGLSADHSKPQPSGRGPSKTAEASVPAFKAGFLDSKGKKGKKNKGQASHEVHNATSNAIASGTERTISTDVVRTGAGEEMESDQMHRETDSSGSDEVALLQQGVVAGVPGALFHLGVRYLHGDGVLADPAQAAEMFKKAQAQHATLDPKGEALNALGLLCLHGGVLNEEDGSVAAVRGLQQDMLEAVKCFHEAAAKGHQEAGGNLRDILAAIEEAGGEAIPGLEEALKGEEQHAPRYPTGCLLRVVGHHAETGEYAERAARVAGYDTLGRLYRVEIDSDVGESCLVKEINLQPLAKGTLVELTGLKARADLNGHGGVVRRYVEDTGRYKVQVVQQEGASVIAVKGENLMLPLPFYDGEASGVRRLPTPHAVPPTEA